jgi:ankyrin repeat protein
VKLGRNAIGVIAVSLVLILGSIVYIRSQQQDEGRSRDQMNGPGFTPRQRMFVMAIRSGSAEDVARILDADPSLIKERIPDFGTGLHVAAALNQDEVANLLLDRGADIAARGRWGGTPLHLAAWLGSKDTVALLLHRGADSEARCEAFGSTPLLWAAHGSTTVANPRGDYIETCRLLIAAGAHADTANRDGNTAVTMATPAVADFLLKNGARPAPPTTQPIRPEPGTLRPGQRV